MRCWSPRARSRGVLVEVHLRAEDFYRESHRLIFEAILALDDKHEGDRRAHRLRRAGRDGRARDGRRQGLRAPARRRGARRPATCSTTPSSSRSRRRCGAARRHPADPGQGRRAPRRAARSWSRTPSGCCSRSPTPSAPATSARSRTILHEEIDKLEALSRDGQAMTGTPSGLPRPRRHHGRLPALAT